MMSERCPSLELNMERYLENEITKQYGSYISFRCKDDKGTPIGPLALLPYGNITLTRPSKK